MFNKNQKNYTLNDIEKIFTYTPKLFIILLAILAITITYTTIDAKKNKQIDLIKQKLLLNNQFEKKDILDKFINNINKQVDEEFIDIKTNIKKIVYNIIGRFESNKNNKIEINKLVHYIRDIKNKYNIDIVIFKQNGLKILYGNNTIYKLQDSLFRNKNKEKFKTLILQYIYSQGENNLQYWRYDLQKNLIISFFDIYAINKQQYFIGAFSNINNVKSITKELIINNIKAQKKEKDYHFWFFDKSYFSTFNYYNNKESLIFEQINKDNEFLKFKILKHYALNDNKNDSFNKYSYYNDKYSYLVGIHYNNKINYSKKIIKINKEYDALFIKIISFIIFLTIILLIFSLVFTKFIKNIFKRYNNTLILQTKSLEHWKKRFELAIIASNDGLWDIDFKNDSIYFSQQWLNMFGYEKNEIKNFNDWYNLVHDDDKNEVSKKFDNIILEKEENFICEYRLKTKFGKYKWVFARGKLFIEENNDSKRMLMMSMDIDKNKQLTKELSDIELLVEDGRMVIFKCNNDNKLSVNYISSSIKSYGYNKDDFENKKINFKDLIIFEDKATLDNSINIAIQNNKKSFSLILKIKNSSNQLRWIFLRAILLKDDFSNVTQFYGYMYDITKIKVSEEELKLKVQNEVNKNLKKDRLLVQQSKLASMGEMLGNIAHQWRQPLNSVNLILHFIRDNYDNNNFSKEHLEKYINKSKIQIDYMSQTIDDFRNFYKPSKLANEFNISNVINDVLEILKVQIKLNNIIIELDLENIYITNYENELKQSLLNIINNAKDAIIKKNEEKNFIGKITITIKKENNLAIISVKNNGNHIKNDIIDKIFEPYFTTKFEKKGTGIGLYMSKTIIETNMRGKIKVKNTNDGVEFIISVPL